MKKHYSTGRGISGRMMRSASDGECSAKIATLQCTTLTVKDEISERNLNHNLLYLLGP